MLLNDIVIHQIRGEWKITSLWVPPHCISAKGETVSQSFSELKHTGLYLSQHLLWYYWLVGCTSCGYPLMQTKHWAFKNQCRMLLLSWMLLDFSSFWQQRDWLSTSTRLIHNQPRVCLKCVLLSTVLQTVRNKEQSCLCSIMYLKLNCLSSRASGMLTRS